MPTKHAKGFSLIEIIVVVAIASAVVMVVANFSNNVNVLNNLVGQQLQAKSDIAQTIQILTSDIRSAAPSANGSYAIVSAGTSSFTFYSDPDRDGTIERERLFFATSSIFRGIIQPTGTPPTYPTTTEVVTDLIDNVIPPASTTPLFSYYDTSYTGTQAALTSTVDVTPIRLIGITFRADTNPTQAPAPQYFSTVVDIRNLRSN